MQTEQNNTHVDETGKISFILTYHNQPVSLLIECVESVLHLSLRKNEREIVIVDDGSDLSPLEDLTKYRDDIVYIRQSNQGVSAARNAGIRIATGRYIQFVDADDALVQTPYEHCLDIVRFHDPDMVVFDLTKTGKAEADFSVTGPLEGSEYLRRHNIRGSCCSYLFRRSLLIDLRFTDDIKYGEDEEFTPQLMLRAERIFFTPAKAYYYRQHAASALHQKGTRDKLQRLNDNVRIIAHLHNVAATLPQADREGLQRRVAQLTMDYLYNIITLTRNPKYLERCVVQLTAKELFPLPDRKYTTKYIWFRRMTNGRTSRRILCRILPKMK